jgi:hypothetical protein
MLYSTQYEVSQTLNSPEVLHLIGWQQVSMDSVYDEWQLQMADSI